MQRSRLHRHFVSLIAGILILAALPASAEDAAQSLYRTEMLRAAPGQLASVIELVKERLPVWKQMYDAGFFHVEIFLALAGKRAELLEQREMENLYLAKIERPTNLIFKRAGGAAWDCYTIGFYRDIKHFAASADVPAEAEESAAIEAGFTSASTIGTYLRELISQHHDTLAVAVR